MPRLQYDLIYADPAWNLELRSEAGKVKHASNHYAVQPLDEIKAMHLDHLASPDCLLWMWCTPAMIREAFEVLDHWGFKYSTMGWWSKITASGKQTFGTGYRLRDAGEPFIIARIGSPTTTKGVRNTIIAERREHSRKPDAALEACEKLMPGDHVRRIELYSRQHRPGWDCWGNEVGKFEAA